jgi:hypothetical protein
MIWEKVFNGRFKSDFRKFCERNQMPYRELMREDTVNFLPCYMLWAGSLLSVANKSFMQLFVYWLDKQPGTELRDRKFDPTTLHARAFEYTAMGAALIS